MVSQKLKPNAAASLKKIKNRILLMVFVCLLGFALLGARTFELHFTDNAKLNRLAKNQYKRRVVVAPKRGNILDTSGETLAIDVKVDSVYGSPHRIQNPKPLASVLAKSLNLSQEKILKKLSKKNRKFVWIKRRISPEESKVLENLELKGIGTLPEYKRFYPNGDLASNLIGAVGYDAQALAGLELSFDKVLKSEDPPLLVEQDAKGRSYAPFNLIGLEKTHQIVLTLDKNIQYIAQRELQRAMESSKAKSGTVMVLEPSTGALLAVAVSPSFDPNRYSEFPMDHWRNRAVTDVMEPGSTFKAFTIASALDSGTVNIDEKFHCENGKMRVGKNIIHDHHPYGLLNLSDIIKHSSNICTFKIAKKMGKEIFIKKIKEFGFSDKTGLSLPGEQPGFLASSRDIGPIQLGTIGFGQGISVTPIQLLMAYGALANQGKLMQPYLVKEIQDANDQTLQKFEPSVVRQVVAPETAQEILQMLETVVEKGGTGTKAALPGFSVAGKTGTAQKVIEGKKGYAKNKYISSFIGIAPATNPKLVVLVSIDEPQGAYYGGLVSAPVFKAIMGQTLAYLKVSPDQEKPTGKKTKVAKAPLSPSRKNPGKKNKPQLKNKRKPAPEGGTDTPIPDLTGLSVREVIRRAQADNLDIKIKGTGICVHQEPMPGDPLEQDTSIHLDCQPPI